MPKPFAVVLLQHQSVRLVGVSINTSLHQAPIDCPRLWNDVFAPRMPELSGKAAHLYQGPSYGVSVFTDHQGLAFDYWAAMEAPQVDAPPPAWTRSSCPAVCTPAAESLPLACCAKPTTTCTMNGPTPPRAWPSSSTNPALNATTAAFFSLAHTMCTCQFCRLFCRLFCPASPDHGMAAQRNSP